MLRCEGRWSFEMTDVELRERVLCGTAATVGGFGGWHAWAAGGSRGGWLEAFRSSGTRVRAAIVKGANTPAKAAFGALVVCSARAGDVIDQRTNGFAGGECLVYGTEGHSVRSR